MIYGLVLAGGRSSRMGNDKSLLTFHDKPQREHVFELLTGFCEKVFISCNHDQQVPSHLNPLPDQFDVGTPLSGILTALKHEPMAAWLVVAVDMPMVNKQVLQHLIDNRNRETNVTCYWDSDHQYPEPLLGVWEPGVYHDVLKFIHNGKNSARGFLMQANITLLEPVAATLHLNINTPEELLRFRKPATDRKE